MVWFRGEGWSTVFILVKKQLCVQLFASFACQDLFNLARQLKNKAQTARTEQSQTVHFISSSALEKVTHSVFYLK